jgi:FlaA1/EpsC-like NDP-sugar epimerase
MGARLTSRLLLLCAMDASLLGVALIAANRLTGARSVADAMILTLPFGVVLISVRLAMLFLFRFYQASLRHAGIDVMLTVVKTMSLSTLVFAFGMFISQETISPEFLVVDWLLATSFIGGHRFFVRFYFDRRQATRNGKRVLIYGAGDMGFLALRQLRMVCTPMGFIDDDALKLGQVLQGIRVLGPIQRLEEILTRHQVEEIIIAIADIPGDALRDVVKRCRNRNVICRILPCFSQMLQMEPTLRNVELSDLIRRAPKDLDKSKIKSYLFGKTVLVTGAAGSVGSELVRQSLKFGPAKIIAFDQSESGLYALSEELGAERVSYCLGDACHYETVNDVFEKHSPTIVFHAAAYKHVPMLEVNALEAIRNNVGSTKTIAEVADRHKVESCVLISTDKAVKPSCVMGSTKRICELLIQNYNRFSCTNFMVVRFGNVLGSSGSVIPKFVEQIRAGGPVTVTHPDAARFFMLTSEAVQLVLQSSAIGEGGEIFILDMGEQVKIVEMAEDLIYLLGYKPHRDIQIVFEGLRPGEKIIEELFHEEIEKRTEFKDITVGRSVLLDWQWFEVRLEEMLRRCANGEEKAGLDIVQELVYGGHYEHALDARSMNAV